MKVAVTVWGKRISPVFDAARTLLIVTVENGVQVDRTFMNCICDNTAAAVQVLRAADVDVLITGAMCRGAADRLESAGIKLFAFVTGKADQVIENYVHGNSLTGHRMPGWCGGRGGGGRRCNRR